MDDLEFDDLDLDIELDDLDFDIDLDMKVEPVYLEIDAVVAKLNVKSRKTFCIESESMQLENLIKAPPTKNECYKMLSGKNGFSSIAVIQYIATREVIEELYVSTFRVGQAQMQVLDDLSDRIKKAVFITSTLQGVEQGKEKYNYGEFCADVCKKNGWTYLPYNNHSKVILMRTKKNYYVCETSSNLNENPKLEQYSFENNKQIYEFYLKMFDAFCNQS